MTGPLRKVRHERFVQALFEGQDATAAYAAAGFSKDDGNATRLRNRPAVQERLAELQAEVAKDTKVTVESICRELDEANAVAKAKGQAAAMVSASALRAKLAGLMVDKVEVGAPRAFDKCDSIEAVVDELLRYGLDQWHPATEADRKGLIALNERHFQEVDEFVASIRARPVIGVRVDTLPKPAIGNGFRRY
jgi:hypothetical protein